MFALSGKYISLSTASEDVRERRLLHHGLLRAKEPSDVELMSDEDSK